MMPPTLTPESAAFSALISGLHATEHEYVWNVVTKRFMRPGEVVSYSSHQRTDGSGENTPLPAVEAAVFFATNPLFTSTTTGAPLDENLAGQDSKSSEEALDSNVQAKNICFNPLFEIRFFDKETDSTTVGQSKSTLVANANFEKLVYPVCEDNVVSPEALPGPKKHWRLGATTLVPNPAAKFNVGSRSKGMIRVKKTLKSCLKAPSYQDEVRHIPNNVLTVDDDDVFEDAVEEINADSNARIEEVPVVETLLAPTPTPQLNIEEARRAELVATMLAMKEGHDEMQLPIQVWAPVGCGIVADEATFPELFYNDSISEAVTSSSSCSSSCSSSSRPSKKFSQEMVAAAAAEKAVEEEESSENVAENEVNGDKRSCTVGVVVSMDSSPCVSPSSPTSVARAVGASSSSSEDGESTGSASDEDVADIKLTSGVGETKRSGFYGIDLENFYYSSSDEEEEEEERIADEEVVTSEEDDTVDFLTGMCVAVLLAHAEAALGSIQCHKAKFGASAATAGAKLVKLCSGAATTVAATVAAAAGKLFGSKKLGEGCTTTNGDKRSCTAVVTLVASCNPTPAVASTTAATTVATKTAAVSKGKASGVASATISPVHGRVTRSKAKALSKPVAEEGE